MYTLITLHPSHLQVSVFRTQTECLDFVEKNNCSRYKIYQPHQKRNLTFLNSFIWCPEKSDFVIDIPKAKEIKKNLLRQVRSILFQKLDTAFIKTIELDNLEQKQYIVSLKNQFRDITDLDLPDEEKALLNFMPAVFKEVYDMSV
jgi:hypothetical protein